MGILYRACKEAMRQNFIQELLAKGFTENENGKSVYDMDYYEVRREITMSRFREKDIENENNIWF